MESITDLAVMGLFLAALKHSQGHLYSLQFLIAEVQIRVSLNNLSRSIAQACQSLLGFILSVSECSVAFKFVFRPLITSVSLFHYGGKIAVDMIV